MRLRLRGWCRSFRICVLYVCVCLRVRPCLVRRLRQQRLRLRCGSSFDDDGSGGNPLELSAGGVRLD